MALLVFRRSPNGLALVLLAAIAASCSGGSPAPTASGTSTSGPRPSSPAVLRIVSPAAGESLTGTTARVVMSLEGGRIVAATSTDIRPDTGHVHLYVDNSLVSMNYGLEQDIPLHPGMVLLKAEFVAADHAPFNPRVWTPEVIVMVR